MTAKTWFTSDHHFFHENVIRHCSRPFSCASEMNDAMIKRWNERVNPGDEVIYVGDFFWNADIGLMREVRERLNGKILLVPGNHDKIQRLLQNRLIDEVLPSIHLQSFVTSEGATQLVVFCHYPLQEWPQYYRGAIHIHGHCHGNPPAGAKLDKPIARLDLSVDVHDFYPIDINEALLKIRQNTQKIPD